MGCGGGVSCRMKDSINTELFPLFDEVNEMCA